MTDVCVLVVTSNHADFINDCVVSVLNSQCACSFNLVVVDNGSVDGTVEILRSYGEQLWLIERESGHSLSSNNNVGFKTVRARYYLVMNPDTILPSNGIESLYNFMETHLSAGACGPKLVNQDGSLQLSCRRFPTPRTFLSRRTPLRYFIPLEKSDKSQLMISMDHDKTQRVDWVIGACTIFRKEALDQIGYFDEQFHLYCEDIDICYRLWHAGWATYYYPKISVVHAHQLQSLKKLFSQHSLWHYQSMLRYILKHGLAGFKRP